jgi:hypothetical protein
MKWFSKHMQQYSTSSQGNKRYLEVADAPSTISSTQEQEEEEQQSSSGCCAGCMELHMTG